MSVNSILKIAGAVIVATSILTASALPFNKYVVWERVGGDQLVWSENEALHFALMIRDGWSGNLLEFAWQYVRGHMWQSGTITNRKTWLVVTRITSDGTIQTVIPDTRHSPIGIFEDHVYAMHQGVLSKWVVDKFVPVDDEEARRFHPNVTGGVFSNVNGWSSTVNLVKGEPGERKYTFALGGVPVTVFTSQGSARLTVSVQHASKPPMTILDVDTETIQPDQTRYQQMFAPGTPQ